MEKITLDYILNTPTHSEIMQEKIKRLSSIIEQMEDLKKEKQSLYDSLYQHFWRSFNKEKISKARSEKYARDKLNLNKQIMQLT